MPMQFPPGDVVASFGMYLKFRSLADLLRMRHPDLAPMVSVPDIPPHYVKIDLGDTQGALLAITKIGGIHVWAVTAPGISSRPIILPLNGMSDENLVDTLHAAASAHVQGRSVASPWRWGESEVTPIVQLADQLTANGAVVHNVVGKNHYFLYHHADGWWDPRVGIARTGTRSYLDATYGDFAYRASHHKTLGWRADIYDPRERQWARLADPLGAGDPQGIGKLPDIADLVDVSPEAIAYLACELTTESRWECHDPWSPLDAPPFLAAPDGVHTSDLLEELLPTSHSAVERGVPQELPPDLLVRRVESQLRAFGLADVEWGDASSPLVSHSRHIAWHNSARSMSTSEVQRLNGVAAAEEKQLLVLTRSGLTRPAGQFADKAKALAFQWDAKTGLLFNGNARGTELLFPCLEDFEMSIGQRSRDMARD
ncbi:hypothetical protein [Streptomyces erythrochromogenes]|uniref:hypothetical protein n=1 Tax=Streptomyces erythrochromogenes TaxID=285574 RepID=UPI00341E8EFE